MIHTDSDDRAENKIAAPTMYAAGADTAHARPAKPPGQGAGYGDHDDGGGDAAR